MINILVRLKRIKIDESDSYFIFPRKSLILNDNISVVLMVRLIRRDAVKRKGKILMVFSVIVKEENDIIFILIFVFLS